MTIQCLKGIPQLQPDLSYLAQFLELGPHSTWANNQLTAKASPRSLHEKRSAPPRLEKLFFNSNRNSFRVLITCSNFSSMTGMIPFLVWVFLFVCLFIIFIRLFPRRGYCSFFLFVLDLRVKLLLLLHFYWTCSIFLKFHNLPVTREERL